MAISDSRMQRRDPYLRTVTAAGRGAEHHEWMPDPAGSGAFSHPTPQRADGRAGP